MSSISFNVVDPTKGKNNVIVDNNTLTFIYPCQSTIVCTPYAVDFLPGVYRISLWGGEGGNARVQNSDVMKNSAGGKGAFVSGEIKIVQKQRFYLFLGGKGEDLTMRNANSYGRGGYNGGGAGGYDVGEYDGESNAGGGGASDLRLINAQTTEGWKSRIIVAGAGGSACAADNSQTVTDSSGKKWLSNPESGAGGALSGFSSNDFTFGGQQTSGLFGKGMNGLNIGTTISKYGGSTGGGGSGYYGGTSVFLNQIQKIDAVEAGGAGGSSFVSGCSGCDAVSKFPENTVQHTGKPNHFSGLIFRNIEMKTGKEPFLSPFKEPETGHRGSGAASISLISPIFQRPTCISNMHNSQILFTTILLLQSN